MSGVGRRISAIAKHRLGRRTNKAKHNVVPFKRWRIVRGDKVMVNRGHDKGRTGVIKKVDRKFNRVIVDGLNMYTKYTMKSPENPSRPISVEAPLHISNVNLVCPETNEPTKVSVKFLEDGTKVRVARVSGAIIPKPVHVRKTVRRTACAQDTIAAEVVKKTFNGLSDLMDLDGYGKKLPGSPRYLGSGGRGNIASPNFVRDSIDIH